LELTVPLLRIHCLLAPPVRLGVHAQLIPPFSAAPCVVVARIGGVVAEHISDVDVRVDVVVGLVIGHCPGRAGRIR
jgi:hypothetical protein